LIQHKLRVTLHEKWSSIVKDLQRLMLATIAFLPLAACSTASILSENTIVTPSGKMVQAPPLSQRWGDKGGESGGSGRN
jgi:hypothetical protein